MLCNKNRIPNVQSYYSFRDFLFTFVFSFLFFLFSGVMKKSGICIVSMFMDLFMYTKT